MDDPVIESVRGIMDLGMPAVVLIQSIVLYRALMGMTDRYISALEQIADIDRRIERKPPLSSE